MFDSSRAVAEAAGLERVLASLVSELEPDLVALPDAPGLWETYAKVERLAATAKTLLARRVAASRVWAQAGMRRPEEWMAAQQGSTVGAARDELDTSQRLQNLDDTLAAAKAGAISEDQLHAVADAAAVNPDAEAKLLGKAQGGGSLKDLRDECQKAKADADPDPDATRKRLHEQRSLRSWTGRDGAWNLSLRGLPEHGAAFWAALAPHLDTVFNEARRDGRRERHEAYAYDAFQGMCRSTAGGTKGDKARYRALIRVDLTALLRGHTVDGEVCDLPGYGPVPVAVVRDLLGDSLLHLVLTNGTDVVNLTHLGRRLNGVQKLALLWNQHACQREGCNRTITENDHRVPYSETRWSRVDETDRLCPPCHDLKTHHSWALIAGTGKRPLVPPHDPRHPDHQPQGP